MEHISGIYKIINKTNGKYYVGSSDNIKRRWYNHKNKLRKNKHYNYHLQQSWNKYGEPYFDFIFVEITDEENLVIMEQKYLDIVKNERDKCYNISLDANKPEMNEETRKKISVTLTGRYRGKDSPHYGKHHTKETIGKLSNIKKGKPSPNRGKKMADEQKEKIRQSILKIRNQISENQSKNWVFISPKGEHIKVHNLSNFCKENNLVRSNMCLVSYGERKSHKGWTLPC
jgi:group I intron endonuclease